MANYFFLISSSVDGYKIIKTAYSLRVGDFGFSLSPRDVYYRFYKNAPPALHNRQPVKVVGILKILKPDFTICAYSVPLLEIKTWPGWAGSSKHIKISCCLIVWAGTNQSMSPGAGQPTQVHVYQLPVQKLNLCLDIDHDHDHDDPLCNEMMMIISTMIISLASLPRVSAEQ